MTRMTSKYARPVLVWHALSPQRAWSPAYNGMIASFKDSGRATPTELGTTELRIDVPHSLATRHKSFATLR